MLRVLNLLALFVLCECLYIQPDLYCDSQDVVYIYDAEGIITSNWNGTYLNANCLWVINVPYPRVTFTLNGNTWGGDIVTLAKANISDWTDWSSPDTQFSISLDFSYHGYFWTDPRLLFTVFFRPSYTGGDGMFFNFHWVSTKEGDDLRNTDYLPVVTASDGNSPRYLVDGIYSCIAANQTDGWFSSGPGEHSILVDFQKPILAAWYSVICEGDCVLPSSFNFSGSNNNVHWDILDVCNTPYTIDDLNGFNFVKVINPLQPAMQYRYFRLMLPAGNQSIGELEITSRNDTLLAGQTLYENSNITSLSGQYSGVLLPNGTFVVYDTINNSCVWSLVTPSKGMKRSGVADYMLTMMLDGNLGLFSSGTLLWNTTINTTDITKAVLLNSGALRVYSVNSSAILWASDIHLVAHINDTNGTVFGQSGSSPDDNGTIIGAVVGSVLGLVILGLLYYLVTNQNRTSPNNVILMLHGEIRSHYDDYIKNPNKWTGDPSETVFTKELKPGSSSYEKLTQYLKVMQGEFIKINSAFAVHNYNLLYSFAAKHHNITTQVNENEAVFWKKQWVTDELGLRDWTCQMYKDLCDKFEWNHSIKVPIIMTIHGTDERYATSIIKTGFVALGKLDDGYFGKGMYFTSSMRYALPYFGNKVKPAILLSLTITGNPFPVIEHPFKSEKSFNGVALVRGHHSHYVLTRANGYPCPAVLSREKNPFYDEIVIEQESSILPFYLVNISKEGLMEVVADYQKEVSNIKKEENGEVDERTNLGRFEDTKPAEQ